VPASEAINHSCVCACMYICMYVCMFQYEFCVKERERERERERGCVCMCFPRTTGMGSFGEFQRFCLVQKWFTSDLSNTQPWYVHNTSVLMTAHPSECSTNVGSKKFVLSKMEKKVLGVRNQTSFVSYLRLWVLKGCSLTCSPNA